ncbi:hypothetical protein [Achromobacter piechaudii]|uniref:Uncharacterized protein n=1 Tax=Achromobacter piechaudii ATCC 43553 TaxID=742159 RepID=D4XAQ6_9BURK|nr:hypothetical protein [Achromobacter piechaudii]EFF76068.1 hypothetical protein HMPREF0004_2553 [Achromobacter piechaudii ATCC 43553]
MSNFKFEIGAEVHLAMSGEKGVVVGRAEYEAMPPNYFVRYVAADGRLTDGWFEGQVLN